MEIRISWIDSLGWDIRNNLTQEPIDVDNIDQFIDQLTEQLMPIAEEGEILWEEVIDMVVYDIEERKIIATNLIIPGDDNIETLFIKCKKHISIPQLKALRRGVKGILNMIIKERELDFYDTPEEFDTQLIKEVKRRWPDFFEKCSLEFIWPYGDRPIIY